MNTTATCMSAPHAVITQNADINALKSKIYEQEQVIRALTNEIVRLNSEIERNSVAFQRTPCIERNNGNNECIGTSAHSNTNITNEPSTTDAIDEIIKKHMNAALDYRIRCILNERSEQIINTRLDNSLDKRIENKIKSELRDIINIFVHDTDCRIMGTIHSTCRDYINDYLDEMMDEHLECLLKDRLRVNVDEYLNEILGDMVRELCDHYQTETCNSIKELDDRMDGLEIDLNDEIDSLRIDVVELKNKIEGGSIIRFESDSFDKEDCADENGDKIEHENNDETINEPHTVVD